MTDSITHLDALQLRLSNERIRLANAKNAKEIAIRTIWVERCEKEVADEFRYLGMDSGPGPINEDDLLADLLKSD